MYKFRAGLCKKIKSELECEGNKICGWHLSRDRSRNRNSYVLDVSEELDWPLNADLHALLEILFENIFEIQNEREDLRIPRHIAFREENDEAADSAAYIEEEHAPIDRDLGRQKILMTCGKLGLLNRDQSPSIFEFLVLLT